MSYQQDFPVAPASPPRSDATSNGSAAAPNATGAEGQAPRGPTPATRDSPSRRTREWGPFHWEFDRPMWVALVWFVGLVAIFTIVLRPYDTFNLGIFLYEGSYTALGQNPYAVLSIPAPPNLQLLGLGSYLSYAAYGYDLSGAIAFYKVANGVLAVLSSLIVANIAARLARWSVARTRVFVVLLLSPPIFFFSFVHVQVDLFGIFWSLLGVYLYFFSPRWARWDFLRTFAALVLLVYAVYAYAIPIALFPAIIVYEPTWRRRLLLVLGSAAALLLYLLPNFALWTYLPGNPVGSTGSSANSPYSLPFVLNNVPGYQWGLELLVIWGVLAVVVPILLRFWKVDVFAALIVSMLVVFLVLPIYNGDEFIWLLPWMTLGLALYSPKAPSWGALLLVQCILLPLIVVFNFYDGLLGMGTGVYYLFFPQFSVSTAIWEHVPHAIEVAQVLMGSVFAAMVAFGVLIVRRARTSPLALDLYPRLASDSTASGSSNPGADPTPASPPPEPARAGRTRVATATAALLVVVLVALVVVFSVAQPPASIEFQSNDPGFATGMFLVHPPPDDNLSYTLVNGGRTVVLPPTNPAFNGSVAFIRNTTGERVELALSVGVAEGGTTLYNTTILESANLEAQVVSMVDFPGSVTVLHPTLALNVSSAPPSPSTGEGTSVAAYNYSGTSLTQYDLLASTGTSSTYSFFFQVAHLSVRQNVIWSLTTGTVTSELVALPTSTGGLEFELGTTVAPGVWVDQLCPLVSLDPWNLVEITTTARGLTIALDGLTLTTVPSSLSLPRLDVGRFSANSSTADNNSFVGFATEPIDTSVPLSTAPGLEVVVDGTRSPVVTNWNGELNVTITGGDISVGAAGQVWTADGAAWFAVGRLSPSTTTVYETLRSLLLSSEDSRSLLAPFLLLALVVPVVFAALPWVPSLATRSPRKWAG